MFLSKILDWIKKHVWQTFLIGFGLFFVPLIFVHIAYRIPAISPWFASTWEAGELITYIAGFLAFLGTVVLGAVAVRQNEKANMINSKLLLLEKRRSIFERKPEVDLYDFRVETLSREELFNINRTFYVHPNFPSRDIDDLHVIASVYYLISFSIENKSKFVIEAGVQSLKIQDIRGGNVIKYSNIPFPYGTEFSEILSMNVNSFSMVMDDHMLRFNSLLGADLIISIINSAGDRYKIISSFVVSLEGCKGDTTTKATIHSSVSPLVPDEDLYL